MSHQSWTRRLRGSALLAILMVVAAACGSTAPTSSTSEVPVAGTGSGTQTGSGGLSAPGSGGLGAGGTGGTTAGGTTAGGTTGGTTGSGTSTGGTTGGTTTGGTTGGGTHVAASAPGITATTMNVGISYNKNQCQANAALGAGGLCSDARHAYNAMIDEVNKEGGLAGLKVAPVYHGFDANSSETSDQQEQEACADWTQDHKVFIIFFWGTIMDPCAKKAGALELGGPPSFPETYEQYPHRIDFDSLNSVREGNVTIDGLHKKGYFNDKGAKYGFVTWDDPQYKEAVNRGYLPSLKHYGISLTDTAYLHSPQTPQEVGQTSADASSAILRFKAAGIDHVMILDGPSGACAGACIMFEWMRQADGQDYRPRYGLNDSDGPPEAALQAGLVPASQLKRSIAVGWNNWNAQTNAGLPPNRRLAECKEIMRKHGVDISNLNELSDALNACDNFWFMQIAIARMPGALSADGFVAGVNRIGYDFSSVATFGNFLSATRHDGIGAARIGVFDDKGCGCYKYPDPPYRV